ncbi:Density-regulated -like protein [Sarcoptes scabiei]|uniref:Density-regulated protein homolog n=1 Tax=Sarcoptes scabiei TaxID=52283 RepID=A0A132AFT8_SARSC|nr:Density-regulated -like protein [Sarcoptes scabiei]KPM09851.1 density-regulated protein-like protein [Sarcoptes scabiei]
MSANETDKKAEEITAPKTLPNGPIEGVQYPLKIDYCGVCTLPLEYCEFTRTYNECKEWLEKNLPELFEQLETNDDEKDPTKKSRQKRGGKALLKPKKKDLGEQIVKISRANRGKKKYVTFVQGLGTFEIDLKEATKFFSSRFACGSSISGSDEIIIQGDVKDDLFDVISDKWNQIEENFIEDLGDVKR